MKLWRKHRKRPAGQPVTERDVADAEAAMLARGAEDPAGKREPTVGRAGNGRFTKLGGPQA